jgi:hypothetical protein
VNGADLMIVQANLGSAGFWYQGDFDADGRITTVDLQIARAAVPEPSTLLLGSLAIGVFLLAAKLI